MKTKNSMRFLLLLLSISAICSGQSTTNQPYYLNAQGEPVNASGIKESLYTKDGKRIIRINNDSLKKQNTIEQQRYIVKFKEQPLTKYAATKSGYKAAVTRQNEIIADFKTDFNRLVNTNTKKSGNSTEPDKIRHMYKNTFFGASVSMSNALVNEIKALSYVESVERAKKVEINTYRSIPLIGADSVWINLGFTGKGIKIGIIDTGVDYNNPDLGGGIGEGYKVTGGYDFVNDDNDPMDDHSHGTHVSGIAAGIGDSIKGVAPEASLYAFKVLDASGSGYSDDIIAAIEQCVDPNQDGDFSDKLDVVNISLGGGGTYLDAGCQAVDNASELGVVFCIAAGNSGEDGSFTIGSPGAALNAITVGASDFNDELAYFSSIGPNADTLTIKPEVLAPGVNILSTILNGKTAEYSGTSMATPHVAGLCALLKQAHPKWEYREMKSALMTTAKDIGMSPFSQGAGRVQALKAVLVSSQIIPSQLSFGNYPASTEQWNKQQTVTLINIDTLAKNYTVTFSSKNAGASLVAEPANFTIQPGDSLVINLSLTITQSQLSESDSLWDAISGNVYFASAFDTFHIPWAVTKLVELSFTNSQDWIIDIFNRNTDKSINMKANAKIWLPKGEYDILADYIYSQSMLCFSDFELTKPDTIDLKIEYAKNRISARMVDETGVPITENNIYDLVAQFKYDNYTVGITFTSENYSSATNYVYMNDIDTSVVVGYRGMATTKGNKIYALQAFSKGLSESKTFTNNSNNFATQNLNIQFPKAAQLHFVYWGEHEQIGSMPEIGFFYLKNSPWKGTLYFPKINEFGMNTFVSYELNNQINAVPFKLTNDSVACYYNDKYSIDLYKAANNKEYVITDGPVKMILNSGYYISETPGMERIISSLGFVGHNSEGFARLGYTGIEYKIKNGAGTVVSTGKSRYIDTLVQPDIYYIEYNMEKLYTKPVIAPTQLLAKFDLRKEDATPPSITSLQIRNAEYTPTNLFKKGENAKIKFAVGDYYYIDTFFISAGKFFPEIITKCKTIPYDSIQLYFKNSASSEWIKLPHSFIALDERIGHYMEADISAYTNVDSATFDIRITAADFAGNTCEEIWHKCLIVDTYSGSIAVNDYYETVKNKSLNVTAGQGILANDTPNFDYFICEFNVVQKPLNGNLILQLNGSFYYSPKSGFIGEDKFTYVINNCIGEPDTAEVTINVKEPVSVKDDALDENKSLTCYPNPFSNEVTISFTLTENSPVSIEVFDLMAKRIATVKNEMLPIGENKITWDGNYGNNLPCTEGIYLIRMVANGTTQLGKVILKR